MGETYKIASISLALLSGLMALAWALQRRTQNAGIVDLFWTASLGALALSYAIVAEGWGPRRLLVALLVGTWSLRLSLHLAQRLRSEPEDGRYAALRASWGDGFQAKLFAFFQAQAWLAFMLSLPFLVLARAQEPGWRAMDGVALALFVISQVGEAIADRQLRRWRSDPSNQGKTCRRGLWKYSRHPNYFFEWIHWWVYPVLGLGLPLGGTLWLAPAAMLFFVLKVTGIPPTEAHALRSRGEDYRHYQLTTNAFFPGPRRPAHPGLPNTP